MSRSFSRKLTLGLALVGIGVGALALGTPEAAARADLGTLTRIDQGRLRYRWQRGALAMELHDRDGRWSEDEALRVRDSLDILPDVVLRKAIEVAKVRRIYRDLLPRSPSGTKERLGTTVVRDGYIAIGDKLLARDGRAVIETMVHEVGHAVHYSISGWALYEVHTPGWTSISWTSAVTDGLKSWNGFVSDYARTNDHEDFAESFEFYWLNPDELRRVSPTKHAFMRRVFGGLESPSRVRYLDKKAIDPVGPVIERLGDTVDTPGSIVKVHGQRFMGPLDGGFNRVRYRGARALHLPLSRRTVTSWVPAIGAGSAPITVQTQDGTSAPAAFRVKKPWWQFW